MPRSAFFILSQKMAGILINEENLATLLFKHINDSIVWCRMMQVSHRFNHIGKKFATMTMTMRGDKHKNTFTLKLQNGYKLIKWWYANGQIDVEINFLNNKKHGVCRSWYPSGKLYYKENWQNGKIHGLSTYWHELNGTYCTIYYDKGKPIQERLIFNT